MSKSVLASCSFANFCKKYEFFLSVSFSANLSFFFFYCSIVSFLLLFFVSSESKKYLKVKIK